MEDIREQGLEHGVRLQLLATALQGGEAGEEEIYSDLLQSSVQELGTFGLNFFYLFCLMKIKLVFDEKY